MTAKRPISAHMEDYLEAIATLKKEAGVARVKDISRLLNVKNPSVNSALNALSAAGLVVHEKYGYADLTKEGEAAAESVMVRHGTLVEFLTSFLSVDHITAEEDACKMEHVISEETLHKIQGFLRFLRTVATNEKPEWLESFHSYLKTVHSRPERKRTAG